MKELSTLLLILFLMAHAYAQRQLGVKPSSSGGPLSSEQASYNIHHYQLDLAVQPHSKSIAGSATIEAKILNPLEVFVLDLDSALHVSSVEIKAHGETIATTFKRTPTQIHIHANRTWQPDEHISVVVYYDGKPRVAPRPPWVGGFVWDKTQSGADWITTTCQFDGADLWYPCKDHPSDEADSITLNIEVPSNLLAIANGKRLGIQPTNRNTRIHSWKSTSPLNNYNIALNIAPYDSLTTTYTNVLGEVMPITMWVLPEHKEKAKPYFAEFTDHLAFYEQYLGPYPYRSEKYGVVETPHLGMEHSTVIAFGADRIGNTAFKNNQFGWNFLHHHELGHEWWGNLVTAADWKDFWIHEGFCIYMQALYNEHKLGIAQYHHYFEDVRPKVRNKQALAPYESKSTLEKYFLAPDYQESDGDIYTKGALVLHTLRYLIGKEALLASFRKLCYPTPAAEKATDGSQFHFVSSADFIALAEKESGQELDWFFDVYLRQPELPNLLVNHKNDSLFLAWDTPIKAAFEMPVEVKIGGQVQRISMEGGKATLPLSSLAGLEIDPKNWIFKKSEWKAKRELRQQLAQIPNLTFEEIPARKHFKQAYHLTLTQPLDHKNPKAGSFQQHMYLSHVDFTRPMLLETSGYEAYNYPREISQITQGNQLITEYRYFGKSKPATNDWKYLRNEQSVEDYHRITTLFKPIYGGKWISSGISKGGAMSITYRSKYPNDVAVTVPYVAPIALAREDERTTKHINTIGEQWCRDSLYAFQKRLLLQRDALIPLLKTYAKKKKYTYSIGYETALEYAALEYTFSFWQWLGDCAQIPAHDASPQDMFNHVNNTVGWSFYSDQVIEQLAPSYYQHMIEIGYYGFEKAHLLPLLKVVKQPDNLFFTPEANTITYDPSYMKNVWNWATHQGERFIYIYGQYDTWSACAITPDASLDALKMVKIGGVHSTRIRHFSEENKQLIYNKLREWLEIDLEPLRE
ncbi:MAG: M1 family aminopeptidase [Flammeovirgaceae bacterium]